MSLLTNQYAITFVSNTQTISNTQKHQQNQLNMYSKHQFSSLEEEESKNQQTCINKICKLYKHDKKSLLNDPQKLCTTCLIQYNLQNYCLYCKQIYFEESDDGKQWILCEQCSRWVHSQCANYDSMINSSFKCIKCRKNQHVLTHVSSNNQKKNNKISKIERRKNNQCNLNAFGFYWQLGPAELAEDLNKIKQYLK